MALLMVLEYEWGFVHWAWVTHRYLDATPIWVITHYSSIPQTSWTELSVSSTTADTGARLRTAREDSIMCLTFPPRMSSVSTVDVREAVFYLTHDIPEVPHELPCSSLYYLILNSFCLQEERLAMLLDFLLSWPFTLCSTASWTRPFQIQAVQIQNPVSFHNWSLLRLPLNAETMNFNPPFCLRDWTLGVLEVLLL